MSTSTSERRRPAEAGTAARLGGTRSQTALGLLRLLLIPVGAGAYMIVARHLGERQFGKFALALSIASLLTTLMGAGLPQLITKEAALRTGSHDATVFGLCGVQLVSTVVVWLVWIACATPVLKALDSGHNTTYINLIAVAAAQGTLFVTCAAILKGKEDSVGAQLSESILLTILPAMGFLGGALSATMHRNQDALFLRAASLAIGCIFVTVRALRMLRRPPGRRIALSLPAGTRPAAVSLLIVSLLFWAQAQLPLWLVASRAGEWRTSQFAAAQRMMLLAQIPAAIVLTMTSAPLARASDPRHRDDTQRLITPIIRRGALQSLLLVAVMLAASPRLLPWLWTVRSSGFVLLMVILCATALVQVLTGPCVLALTLGGLEHHVVGSVGAGSAAMVAVSVLLGGDPRMAAATGGLVGVVVSNAIATAVVHRELGISTLAWFGPNRLSTRGAPR